tara:strand:+ start:1834 stop:2583 length:750 start_codon:yes stop_codon:yes gene_type:complete
MSKNIILIPSRLRSKRLKNKPLLEIDNIPLVVHTYKRSKLAKKVDDVFVCTDSTVIKKKCEQHGAKVIMTSVKHLNGTERIAEAAKKLKIKNNDIIIDVQGDEPLVNPKQIDLAINFFKKNDFDIVLPNIKVNDGKSKNIVKLIVSDKNRVRWMSRSESPLYFKQKKKVYYKHLSVIVFNKNSLNKYSKLKPTMNEKIESIELLRAIESDMKVGTFSINSDTFSVDVLEDYLKAQKYFKKDKLKKKYLV